MVGVGINTVYLFLMRFIPKDHMNFTELPPQQKKLSAFTSLLLLVAFVFLGTFIGQFAGMLMALPFFGFDLQLMIDSVVRPLETPSAKGVLLALQGGSALFGFILAPLVHQRLIDHRLVRDIFAPRVVLLPLALGVVIMLAFMFASSIIIEWNMNLDFSGLSPAFDAWARAKEEELRELTVLITRFESIGGLLIGLMVIAVIPAVGEELLFRGVGQWKLYTLLGNPHAAIWAAALLFSAIHFQFYGFFPRLLLGALFGYLYYWSGNLWYAIVAHFVNNAFLLIMLYLSQQGSIDFDVESSEAAPWSVIVFSALMGAVALLYFKNLTQRPTQRNG